MTIGAVAGLPPKTIAEIIEALAHDRDSVPLDIPHPSFKGPF